jgi:SlyX protein
MTQSSKPDINKVIDSLNKRIDELEMKVIFQDDLLNTLNDIVTRQDKEVSKLWDANRLLKQSMHDMKSDFTEDNVVDVPPPHY